MKAALVIVVGLTVLAASPAMAQLSSPGPLTNAHKKWDEDCDDCHKSGKRISKQLCLGCHRDLNRRVGARAGLHGKTYKGRACESCHVEHIGRKARLIRWPGGSPKRFNHKEAGWTLKGKHRQAGCEKCHKKRNSRGAKTYLGLPTRCESCHKDPHKGSFGGDCNSCHSESNWRTVNLASFNHAKTRFPLRGKHDKVECINCHGTPPKYRGLRFAECDDCHKDPHKRRFRRNKCSSCHVETSWQSQQGFRRNHPGLRLGGGHRKITCKKCHDRGNLRPPSKGRACKSCHKPVHLAKFGTRCASCHASIRWTGLSEKIGRKHHKKTRYPLVGRHKKVGCKRCHSKSKPPAKRFRGLAFSRCDSCHRDKHGGEFVALDKGECAQCHRISGFRPTTFGIALHAKASFPLEGRHIATPCGKCHTVKRPRLSFKVTKKSCADCHENPHGNQFAVEMSKRGCAHCHNTGGWDQPKIDHSTWPLTGAHSRTACDACHSPSAADRKTGKGTTYRGVARDCHGCHEDVHAGQFRLSNPKKACEVCHATSAFSIKTFDHNKKTSYRLTGGHQKLDCAKCHPKEKLQTGKESVRYRLGYRACKDCHANPHPN